jgi:hypothetical protein
MTSCMSQSWNIPVYISDAPRLLALQPRCCSRHPTTLSFLLSRRTICAACNVQASFANSCSLSRHFEAHLLQVRLVIGPRVDWGPNNPPSLAGSINNFSDQNLTRQMSALYSSSKTSPLTRLNNTVSPTYHVGPIEPSCRPNEEIFSKNRPDTSTIDGPCSGIRSD